MTVCFFANIGTGHLNPMLALAERLANRGWKVLFYAPAHACDRVSATGAEWRAYGTPEWCLFDTAKRATRELLMLPPDVLLDMSIVAAGPPASAAMLPWLIEEIRAYRPEFTVHDAAASWGALAARFTNTPAVCSMSAFPLTRDQAVQSYPPGRIQLAAANYMKRHFGLDYDPGDSYVNYTGFNLVFTAEVWVGEEATARKGLHFCGPTEGIERSPGHDNSEDHPAIAAAKRARASGKKVAYASFGTVVTGTLDRYYGETVKRIFRDAARALAGRDDIHLICSAGRKQGGAAAYRAEEAPAPLTDWFDHTPQTRLLRHTDVFLTHAGMNSANEAAMAGVPVVCCPFFGDGPINARRFSELEAGITVDYRIAPPAQIAAGAAATAADRDMTGAMQSALMTVLDDPSFRTAAIQLQDAFERQKNVDRQIEAMLQWAYAGKSRD